MINTTIAEGLTFDDVLFDSGAFGRLAGLKPTQELSSRARFDCKYRFAQRQWIQ